MQAPTSQPKVKKQGYTEFRYAAPLLFLHACMLKSFLFFGFSFGVIINFLISD